MREDLVAKRDPGFHEPVHEGRPTRRPFVYLGLGPPQQIDSVIRHREAGEVN